MDVVEVESRGRGDRCKLPAQDTQQLAPVIKREQQDHAPVVKQEHDLNWYHTDRVARQQQAYPGPGDAGDHKPPSMVQQHRHLGGGITSQFSIRR